MLRPRPFSPSAGYPEDESSGDEPCEANADSFSRTSPVYNGVAHLLKWAMSGSQGATVRLHLADSGEHPFRGMRWGRENGQLLRVVVSIPEQDDSTDADVPALPPGTTVYAGEGVVLWWAEDCANGMSVKIGLNDGPDGTSGRHPFYGLREGKRTGERLVLVAWAVSDDDRPQDPCHVRRREPFRNLGAVKQSQILCRDPRFQNWLRRLSDRLRLHPRPDDLPPAIITALPCPDEDPKGFADAFVRSWCGVESRAAMNREGPEAEMARQRWRVLLRAYEDDVWGRR